MPELYFKNIHDLVTMAGHGPYVWAAYALTLAGLTLLVLSTRMRKRKILRLVRARMRAELEANAG